MQAFVRDEARWILGGRVLGDTVSDSTFGGSSRPVPAPRSPNVGLALGAVFGNDRVVNGSKYCTSDLQTFYM